MNRIEVLIDRLPEYGVDSILIARPVNTAYLSGFTAVTYSRPILTVIGSRRMLIVPELEKEHARQSSVIEDIFTYSDSELGATAGHSPLALALKTAVTAMRGMGLCREDLRLGVEADFLTYHGYQVLSDLFPGQLVPAVGAVEQGRLVKDAGEIALLRTACAIADIGMAAEVEASVPGASELEIAAVGNREMAVAAGRLCPDQSVNVASQPAAGKRTVLPHAITSHYRLADTDVVLHGTGSTVGGYNCEVERSMFIGEPSIEQQSAFAAMLAAQSEGMRQLRPGTEARAIDRVCRDVITEAGYGQYIVHRSGHGMGLEAHEAPHLASTDDTILTAGMVVTVEPGVYVPGAGGFRHSDTLLITDDGCEFMTRYPRDLDALIK